MILSILLLACVSFNQSCEKIIINRVIEYKIENHMTSFEMFSRFDCNEDKCIDGDEINTLMKKVGVPWHCRWPNKVIKYFPESELKNQNECISWRSFKQFSLIS